MTSYTVTIAPDDPDLAVTTIRLEVTDATATIRELRLVPGSSGGLTPGGLPVLDMNQLVAAVVAAVVPRSGSTKPQPEVAAPVQARQGRLASPATPRKAARKRGSGRERSTEDDTVATPARKKAAGKTRPAKPTKVAKKTAAAPAEPGGSSRTYRRVPDDFDQVLRQVGESASVIADHYGVPRHTAYSWIRSARQRAAATD